MITCLSASHKTATTSMIEALKINKPSEFTHALIENDGLRECVLLQTCHRVEIFCVLSNSLKETLIKKMLELWSSETGVSLDLLNRSVAFHYRDEALDHLFFLASGLESMVLGEDQILGQVRNAFFQARMEKTIGLVLNRSFMKAINVGKKVRTETKINEGSVSISLAAIELAEKELGDLASKRALIIGAGEAGGLAAEALRGRTQSQIFVANRTYEKSQALAEKVSGQAIQFGDILTTIPDVDLVIAAISVNRPILTEGDFASLRASTTKTDNILLVDISQPRAFEEKVGCVGGFCLKNIDDLKEVVAANLKSREVEAEKCKIIIAEN